MDFQEIIRELGYSLETKNGLTAVVVTENHPKYSSIVRYNGGRTVGLCKDDREVIEAVIQMEPITNLKRVNMMQEARMLANSGTSIKGVKPGWLSYAMVC